MLVNVIFGVVSEFGSGLTLAEWLHERVRQQNLSPKIEHIIMEIHRHIQFCCPSYSG